MTLPSLGSQADRCKIRFCSPSMFGIQERILEKVMDMPMGQLGQLLSYSRCVRGDIGVVIEVEIYGGKFFWGAPAPSSSSSSLGFLAC